MILHVSLDNMKERSMNAHLILRKCSTHFCSIHCTENDLIGKLKLQFFLNLSKRYCFDQYQKIFAPNNTYTIISNSVYFVPFTCCQNRKHI